MALADRLQAVGELVVDPLLEGDGLHVQDEPGGRVVAGAVAPLDLPLNLIPDPFALSREKFEPGAASDRAFPSNAALLGQPPIVRRPLPRGADLDRPGQHFRGRSWFEWRGNSSGPSAPRTAARHSVITVGSPA